MKALKETDFDFLNSPENPYLLGVKLHKIETSQSFLEKLGNVKDWLCGFVKETISNHKWEPEHLPNH